MALGLLILRVAVDAEEAVELDDLARGGEGFGAVAERDGCGGLLQFGVGHLRSQGALPNQLVQALLLVGAVYLGCLHVGGADGLVCLLRAFGLGGKVAGADVAVAHQLDDGLAAAAQGEVREVDRVRTHVGDHTGFIQALRHHHGLCHGEAQLAGRLLLQGGGGERSRRALAQGARSDVADGESGRLAQFQEFEGLLFLLETMGQFGLQLDGLAVDAGHEEYSRDAIGGLCLEGVDFTLALHDETHGHGLHTSGGQCGLDLAPQDGRELKAHDAVQHATGLLGIHQVEVDVARMFDGPQDGALGDLMEYDSLGVLRIEFQHLVQVPGDGLSLAVLIGRQPYSVGLRGLVFQLADQGALVRRDFILGREVVGDVYAERLLLQVADMSVTGQHLKVLSEELLNSFCFCRRLDNDKVLLHTFFLCWWLPPRILRQM